MKRKFYESITNKYLNFSLQLKNHMIPSVQFCDQSFPGTLEIFLFHQSCLLNLKNVHKNVWITM